MSLAAHRLKVAGITKTLEDWGIVAAVMTHQLGGEDELALEVDASAVGAFAFSAFQAVTLYDPSGNAQFLGRVRRPRVRATGQSSGHVYRCVGPWSYLRETTYQQEHKFPVDEEDVSSVLGTAETARVILHRNPATGAAVNLRNQIKAALDYAIAKDAPITYDVSKIPTLTIPEDQAIDLQCGDVLNRELRWVPHIGPRWNYAGTTPELEFGDTTESGASGYGVQVRLVAGLQDFEAEMRDDLLVPVFEITYIAENRATDSGQTVKWNTVTRDISTVANDGYGEMISTVKLRGAIWNGTAWEDAEPVPPMGLAAAMHKAYSRPFFEMAWTENGETVNWDHKVGVQWNVEGAANGAFEEASSVCQKITRNIGAGTTALQCGPATFLGLQDRIALLVAARVRGPVKAAGESQYGMEEPDPADEPEGADDLEIQAIVRDGTTITAEWLRIRGAIIEEP